MTAHDETVGQWQAAIPVAVEVLLLLLAAYVASRERSNQRRKFDEYWEDEED
jgi:hypothetical protein